MARHSSPAGGTAVQNGLSAAAVTGSVLACAVPVMAAFPGTPADGPVTSALAADVALTLSSDAQDTGSPAVLVRTGLAPVRDAAPDPGPVDAGALLKAAGLADVARQAEQARLAREAQTRCDADLSGLGRVKDHVRDAAQFLSCLYDEPALIGVAQRAGDSEHPHGLAVDLMVRGERGDRIADCALENQDELGVSYVIWEQSYNAGDGWELMEDRGGDTANHYDHVHISFERSAGGSGDPLAERCS